MTDRGSALLEILVIGFAIVVLMIHALLAAHRLQAAGEQATEAAQTAALHASRYGDLPEARELALRLVPNGRVTAHSSSEFIVVVVTIETPLLSIGDAQARYTVVGRGSARVSPYRSNGGG